MAAKGRRGGIKALLVEPLSQIRLGFVFMVLNLVFAVLMGGVFYYYMMDVYQAQMEVFKLSPEQAEGILIKLFRPLQICIGLAMLFVVVSVWVSLRYTYQIYGPLVSIHRYLDELLRGETPARLQLRASDQLTDLAEKLNRLSDSLSGRNSS